jgi:hypothetical protein
MTNGPSAEDIATVQRYFAAADCDLFVFSGGIYGYPYSAERYADQFVDLILDKPDRRKKASLFLTTYGGDPDAAYRIARCLQNHYEGFRLLVAGPCKSAGTLIALGAEELAIAPTGELGPLDVQMAKPDEIAVSGSGLEIFSALHILTSHAFDKFEQYMLELTDKSGGVISTRTASDIAVKLITGMLHPVAAHIEPTRLGEAQRAMDIAKAYGKRLGTANLKPGCMDTLILTYPCHSFVVDLQEARKLFVRVDEFTAAEKSVMEVLGKYVRYPATKSTVILDVGARYKGEDHDANQATGGVAANSSTNGGGRKRKSTPPQVATNGGPNGRTPHRKEPQRVS